MSDKELLVPCEGHKYFKDEQMDINYWIGIIVGSGVVGAIVSGVVTHFLQQRSEREKRNFEIRYEEYKKYLGELEAIAASSRQGMVAVLELFSKQYFPRLQEATTEQEMATINDELNRDIYQMIEQAGFNFHRANSELNGLRLVCGTRLKGLIDNYTSLCQESLDTVPLALEKLRHGEDIVPNEDQLTNLGDCIQKTFDEIFIEMRRELKIE